jgi:hypothetical protein
MGQLKIKRLKEWANRRFSYKILVDGKEQFEIANGQERFLTFDQGATLQAKLMWCGSKKVDIAEDNGNIKEIRVSANKGLNIRLPVVASTMIALSAALNFLTVDKGLKDFVTALLIGVLIGAIGQLTIGRNRFLDIELVKH